MATLVTRSGKGSPLTHDEVDANFNNLNTDKLESADLTAGAGISISGTTITNSDPDQTVSITGLGIASVSGTYPNFDVSVDALQSSDIGSTVQAYDVNTAKYDDATANFTGTLQNGGSNVVVDTDIGSTVQAYDANLQGFVDTFTLPTTDGTAGQVLSTDGSGNLTLADAAGGGGATLEATASGALANGDLVSINADGTVSVVSGVTQGKGSPRTFAYASVVFTAAAFDSNANKIVAVYRDSSQSGYGKAVVGTVSGTSISFGSAVTFATTGVNYCEIVFDSNANKVVVFYMGASNQAKARVGTVSGTSISFGTEVTFDTNAPTDISAVFDTNSNKIVVCYSGDNSYGTAKVGTVSGTSISFGATTIYRSASISNSKAAFDSNLNKIVVHYLYNPTQKSQALVGTVSGTSISFGSNLSPFGSKLTTRLGLTFDSNANKAVFIAINTTDFLFQAVVGTVSGTSISFGSSTTIRTGEAGYTSATFDSNSNKVMAAVTPTNLSYDGVMHVGTVSGTSISFDAGTVFETGRTNFPYATFDSVSNKVIVVYEDDDNSDYGKAVVFQNSSTTAENYIGISDGDYADASTATVQLVGSIDDAQSGLTAGQRYYVQSLGTLAATPDTPEVYAGIAVSSTNLIVKG